MLPIKDNIRSRSLPMVNWLIIAANALVFFYQVSLSPSQQQDFIYTFGLSPANLSLANPLSWFPFLSAMFMHGGWLHFLSNMWVLFIFGDNVEDRMGPVLYLFFYILGGVAAGLAQVFVLAGSNAPTIGASGAIAAVMGAYFLFYPRARVITLVPLFFLGWFMEIPAVIFLGFWFLLQLFNGVTTLSSTNAMVMSGVGWWAHIGGFLFGLVTARLFAPRRRDPNWHADQYYPW